MTSAAWKCISYRASQKLQEHSSEFLKLYIENWKKCGKIFEKHFGIWWPQQEIVMSSHLRHFCPYHQSLSRKNLFFSKRFSSSLEFLALTQIFPCFSYFLIYPTFKKKASEASVAIHQKIQLTNWWKIFEIVEKSADAKKQTDRW